MLQPLFQYLMVATFLAAVFTMLMGIAGLGNTKNQSRTHGEHSNRLMVLRVALCAVLLAEILIYIAYIKPHP